MEPEKWMSRPEWDELVKGRHCPLCAVVKGRGEDDDYGYHVLDLSVSRLRLAKNQYARGYSVLIFRRHAVEFTELDPKSRARWFEDVSRATRIVHKVTQADKMNVEILGNAIPHLHAHITPRYLGDPAPHRPIHRNAEVVHLPAHKVTHMVTAMRATAEELDQADRLAHYLDRQGRVKRWPGKKHLADQEIVLSYLLERFEIGRDYTEREINDILRQYHLFEDWAMLRREFFERGWMNRTKDGRSYWRTPGVKLL